MNRLHSITHAGFDGQDLGLVLAARLARQAPVRAAGGDTGPFPTSVQLGQTVVRAELRTRDMTAAETLRLGRRGTLVLVGGPSRLDQPARRLTLAGAVLVDVELCYEQGAAASAVLRFAAQSPDAATDPFSADDERQEEQP